MSDAIELIDYMPFYPLQIQQKEKKINDGSDNFFYNVAKLLIEVKLLSKSIISYQNEIKRTLTYIDSISNSEYTEYKDKLFSKLLNTAKNNYFDIYERKFNEKKYKDFFSELKKLNFSANSILHLYNNSVCFDLYENNQKFVIEYSKDDNYLTITKTTGKKSLMKECTIRNIKKALSTFEE